jgi:hypothetical protein
LKFFFNCIVAVNHREQIKSSNGCFMYILNSPNENIIIDF